MQPVSASTNPADYPKGHPERIRLLRVARHALPAFAEGIGSSLCHISPRARKASRQHFGRTGKTLSQLCKRDYPEWDQETHGEWLDDKALNEKEAQITFWPEGSLVKCGGVPFWEEYEGEKSARGKVAEFSGKAQRRLMEWTAQIRQDALPVFITLTYPGTWPEDPEEWKRHLDVFCKWLERTYEGSCTLWKLEDQRRGAPHFHLLVWGTPFVPWQSVALAWARCVSPDELWQTLTPPRNRPGKVGAFHFRAWVDALVIGERARDCLKAGVRVEAIRTMRGVKYYVAKYLAKRVRAEGDAWGHVGRFWGVRGRKFAPLSLKLVYTVSKVTQIRFRRVARRFMGSLGYKGKTFGRLLTDNPLQWVRVLDLVESGACEGWHLTAPGCGCFAGPGYDSLEVRTAESNRLPF